MVRELTVYVFPCILLKLEHLIFFHLFMRKKKYEPIFICTSELFFKESHFAVALIV